MLKFNKRVKGQRKWLLLLLSVLVLLGGAFFTPYSRLILGFMLGATASLFNLWSVHRRMKSLSKATKQDIAIKSIGTYERLGFSIVVIFIATRFEDVFNVFALVAGLLMFHAIIVVSALRRLPVDVKKGESTTEEENKIEKR